MSVERIIGIDFGTSTSVMRVKRYRDGEAMGERLDVKEVTFNSMGQSLVPTLIREMQAGEPYYGFDAQKEHKKSTLFDNFKVELESPDPQERERARALTEQFFTYLSKQYKDQSSGGFFGEADETERTLVSYPVKWSEETRRFMLEAAKKAGFKNVEGMDEAQVAVTAVMVQSADYLSQRGYLQDGVPANILMADMGAGTTDLVLCRYTPGKSAAYEILSAWPRDGGALFGGREVEGMLRDYLRGMLPEEDADTVMKKCKLNMFKSWKEDYVSPALARGEAVTDCADMDTITDLLEIDVEEYALDRAAFEEMAAQYLKGFPELVNGCLKDAGLSGDEVDLVLLTGGHSQWYFVKEQLCGKLDRFGAVGLGKIQADPERIIPVPRPQETVALGLVYSPLAKEVRFAGEVAEITPELEKARTQAAETLLKVAIKNKGTTDSQSDSVLKLSQNAGKGQNAELEVWDESMRVLPVTPEEEFEFREVSGSYGVDMGFDIEAIETYNIPDGYEVVKYRGHREVVSVPAQYKGKPVVVIGDQAFAKAIFNYNKNVYTTGRALQLKEVEIPGSCKVISSDAFYREKDDTSVSLIKVIMHKGLQGIGRAAFCNNNNLRLIQIPDGLTDIGSLAFAFCDLQKVNIPSSCSRIEQWAFENNGNLKTVKFLPDAQIEEITETVFRNTNIEQIILPHSCKCEKLIRREKRAGEKGGLFKKAVPPTSEQLITIERY